MKLKSKGVLVTWAISAGPPRNHHSVLCTPMGPLRAVTRVEVHKQMFNKTVRQTQLPVAKNL